MFEQLALYLQSIKIQFTMFDVVSVILSMILISLIVIGIRNLVKAIINYFKRSKEIDASIRESKAKIYQIIEEMKEERIIVAETLGKPEESVSISLQEKDTSVKKKKTRDMPMEERWAEFDERRSKERELDQGKDKKRLLGGLERSA